MWGAAKALVTRVVVEELQAGMWNTWELVKCWVRTGRTRNRWGTLTLGTRCSRCIWMVLWID